MKKIAAALFALFMGFSGAQEHPSSFSAVTVNYNFSPKFFLYAEGQLRGIEDYSYPDYYELKGGLGYTISKNHKPLIGVGRYVNYRDHSLSKEELRVWLQDIITFNADVFKFENRLRAEQSWIYEPPKDAHSRRNRFRYRLNISVPLNARAMAPGVVFANVYDEVFFITPMKPSFARNRVYGGFGYQIDKAFGIASGYLWQREFEAKGNRNLHYVYLALNVNIDHKEHPKSFDFPAAD